MLTSYFVRLWVGFSATQVFGHRTTDTKKIPRDGDRGGGRGVSDAKVSIVSEQSVSK